MGRKRIEIKQITNEKLSTVTYYKRKKGILKKIMELSLLCNLKVFLAIVDRKNDLIIYNSTESISDFIDKYLHFPIKPNEVYNNNDYQSLFEEDYDYYHKSKDDIEKMLGSLNKSSSCREGLLPDSKAGSKEKSAGGGVRKRKRNFIKKCKGIQRNNNESAKSKNGDGNVIHQLNDCNDDDNLVNNMTSMKGNSEKGNIYNENGENEDYDYDFHLNGSNHSDDTETIIMNNNNKNNEYNEEQSQEINTGSIIINNSNKNNSYRNVIQPIQNYNPIRTCKPNMKHKIQVNSIKNQQLQQQKYAQHYTTNEPIIPNIIMNSLPNNHSPMQKQEFIHYQQQQNQQQLQRQQPLQQSQQQSLHQLVHKQQSYTNNNIIKHNDNPNYTSIQNPHFAYSNDSPSQINKTPPIIHQQPIMKKTNDFHHKIFLKPNSNEKPIIKDQTHLQQKRQRNDVELNQSQDIQLLSTTDHHNDTIQTNPQRLSTNASNEEIDDSLLHPQLPREEFRCPTAYISHNQMMQRKNATISPNNKLSLSDVDYLLAPLKGNFAHWSNNPHSK